MNKNEICYRLQAMATMCTFQDACGHDLSQKEIKLYHQAKEEAIKRIKNYGDEDRDIVDVIRCKDCMHWKLPEGLSIHYCIPTHRFSGTNEYCSLGIKRKTKSEETE